MQLYICIVIILLGYCVTKYPKNYHIMLKINKLYYILIGYINLL